MTRPSPELCLNAMQNYVQLFGGVQFSQALESLWELVRACNKYVDSQAPWALFKQGDADRLNTVMHTLLTAMRKVALCLWPVMPQSAAANAALDCRRPRPATWSGKPGNLPD